MRLKAKLCIYCNSLLVSFTGDLAGFGMESVGGDLVALDEEFRFVERAFVSRVDDRGPDVPEWLESGGDDWRWSLVEKCSFLALEKASELVESHGSDTGTEVSLNESCSRGGHDVDGIVDIARRWAWGGECLCNARCWPGKVFLGRLLQRDVERVLVEGSSSGKNRQLVVNEVAGGTERHVADDTERLGVLREQKAPNCAIHGWRAESFFRGVSRLWKSS
jgi:hypothetical protein